MKPRLVAAGGETGFRELPCGLSNHLRKLVSVTLCVPITFSVIILTGFELLEELSTEIRKTMAVASLPFFTHPLRVL